MSEAIMWGDCRSGSTQTHSRKIVVATKATPTKPRLEHHTRTQAIRHRLPQVASSVDEVRFCSDTFLVPFEPRSRWVARRSPTLLDRCFTNIWRQTRSPDRDGTRGAQTRRYRNRQVIGCL